MIPSVISRCKSVFPHHLSAARLQTHISYRTVTTVILLRHGESTWNGAESRFTGWADVPLTVQGRVEAVHAGSLLRSRGFPADKIDAAFTSDLQRAYETCELVLAASAGSDQHTWCTNRIRRDSGLNERHYGILQGECKRDPALAEKYGSDTIMAWRREMYASPPPMDESHGHYLPPPAPRTESLADCQVRVVKCFEEKIFRAMFDENLPTPTDGRVVLVVSHSNAIRALMAAFDRVPEKHVPNIYVPNSVPILYRFDTERREPISTKLQSASGNSHARWLLSPQNLARVRDAVRPGGMLSRAMFDTILALKDHDGDRKITPEQLEAGLVELLREEKQAGLDCAVRAVAKELIRENWYRYQPSENGMITQDEFEDRTIQIWNELHYDVA
uniref:Phosphoglycerate mutase n=1 Tax=Corethron hystrix TaxID=216773 RepID=A0A6U5DX17_9STRA|mmetsp:Transcript_14621/g.32240  ORF Transcript_14621/g.32240 Transcript_14621/m.32240 type:complete len:389 (+) Transcript_14621:248-1414(+)|eukprot:CAMPEP_0113307998 /NCGR_PEP_ID=MMETSP0010_2-20120614/6615_1 /TAXON_ID=216773 ORGANISM="Corethron hystrix, Strain 308" /NCGR_SAMPLE_ID=MMETSP0010_2 /ASSEMBLY_ACC=CAM_ASM_000155 /LENGTH=388 /DNA_ID=CAMNT_0000162957 /DNA_START=222 /DNA_END=1388 /DNA_ORIENTATION=+ /assembly_acc=CAM_ASM_000155